MRLTPLVCPNPMDRSTDFFFAEINALSMDEVMDLLQISKGSASQGLRALRQLGAVSSVFARAIARSTLSPKFACESSSAVFCGNRRTHISIKGVARLKQIEGLLEGSGSKDSQIRGTRRHEILSGWHRQMSRLLPWVKMIVGKSDRLHPKNKD